MICHCLPLQILFAFLQYTIFNLGFFDCRVKGCAYTVCPYRCFAHLSTTETSLKSTQRYGCCEKLHFPYLYCLLLYISQLNVIVIMYSVL